VPDGVVGPDGKPSARRFAVYRNNVVVGLIDTLKAAYPVVVRLVGDEFFQAMARIFVSSHPPQSPMMFDYGRDFAAFIAAFPPAGRVPYLADIARLERAWVEAYHAAEARPRSAAELALGVPPDHCGDASLDLHPSVRLVRSPYPVVTIWQMHLPGATPRPLDASAGAEDALVMRPAAEVEVRALPRGGTAEFLEALRRGTTVSVATLEALRVNPRFDLVANLREVLTLGLIAGWRVAPPLPDQRGVADAVAAH
jgi:hypothetical protein